MQDNTLNHPAFDEDLTIDLSGTPQPAQTGALTSAFGALFRKLDPRTAGYGKGIVRLLTFYATAWAMLSMLPTRTLHDGDIFPNLMILATTFGLGCGLALKIADAQIRIYYGHIHMIGMMAILASLTHPWALPYLYTVTGPAVLGYGAGSAVAVLFLAITAPTSAPKDIHND